MRYSEIITTAFYGIGLNRRDIDLVDGYFLGASHHRFRALEAESQPEKEFHTKLYLEHLHEMMRVIARGDFSKVFQHDSVTTGSFHKPQGWLKVTQIPMSQVNDPRDLDSLLPSPTLFQHMFADPRYPAGDLYPYDILLQNPQIPISRISLEPHAA